MAFVHRERVHKPRHDLRVRIHVRRGHVLVGADESFERGSISSRQSFDFDERHLGRVADDAAFAPAERDADDRALPGHPHRKRFHFVERDAGVVANATFGGAARRIVLRAVTGKNLNRIIRHSYGKSDRQNLFALCQLGAEVIFHSKLSGSGVELFHCHYPRGRLCLHH